MVASFRGLLSTILCCSARHPTWIGRGDSRATRRARLSIIRVADLVDHVRLVVGVASGLASTGHSSRNGPSPEGVPAVPGAGFARHDHAILGGSIVVHHLVRSSASAFAHARSRNLRSSHDPPRILAPCGPLPAPRPDPPRRPAKPRATATRARCPACNVFPRPHQRQRTTPREFNPGPVDLRAKPTLRPASPPQVRRIAPRDRAANTMGDRPTDARDRGRPALASPRRRSLASATCSIASRAPTATGSSRATAHLGEALQSREVARRRPGRDNVMRETLAICVVLAACGAPAAQQNTLQVPSALQLGIRWTFEASASALPAVARADRRRWDGARRTSRSRRRPRQDTPGEREAHVPYQVSAWVQASEGHAPRDPHVPDVGRARQGVASSSTRSGLPHESRGLLPIAPTTRPSTSPRQKRQESCSRGVNCYVAAPLRTGYIPSRGVADRLLTRGPCGGLLRSVQKRSRSAPGSARSPTTARVASCAAGPARAQALSMKCSSEMRVALELDHMSISAQILRRAPAPQGLVRRAR